MSKKVLIVAAICLAAFSGFVSPLAGQLTVQPQSVLYHKTTTQIAYQVSHPVSHTSHISSDNPRHIPTALPHLYMRC